MQRLDRIKIITKAEYFTIPDNSNFITSTSQKTGITWYKYHQRSPYYLTIMINYNTNAATIEFTSKILKDRCIELITIENIRDCLLEIINDKICSIDVDGIISDSTVGNKLDITEDIDLLMTKQLKVLLQMSLLDAKKWKSKIWKNNGIEVKKDLKSDSVRRERLSLYCKSSELSKSSNKPFLQTLKNAPALIEHFTNKTRVEYNLHSKVMIKEVLEIQSLDLKTVFTSSARPLHKIFVKIFDLRVVGPRCKAIGYLKYRKLTDYLKSLLLEHHSDNLEEVENVLRHFYRPSSSFRRKRIEYKRILNIKNIRINEELSMQEVYRLQKEIENIYNRRNSSLA